MNNQRFPKIPTGTQEISVGTQETLYCVDMILLKGTSINRADEGRLIRNALEFTA